ncbi:hypothetical protein NFX31_04960 [Microbacterium azadirachtae]|uniref:hypothetical protein n=1 Tax=Microbacterium azadirachtae TaxID=582680 RepID=UPI0005ECBCEC|nr:hypothetical protein [Microbacterium azadirachtae]UXW86886.1 hypothetical protein NFX31_04960 [Microbacterium azadirachtae]
MADVDAFGIPLDRSLSGWAPQERDRWRDLALAARGHVCIRPTASMVLTTPRVLTDAVRALLALRR